MRCDRLKTSFEYVSLKWWHKWWASIDGETNVGDTPCIVASFCSIHAWNRGKRAGWVQAIGCVVNVLSPIKTNHSEERKYLQSLFFRVASRMKKQGFTYSVTEQLMRLLYSDFRSIHSAMNVEENLSSHRVPFGIKVICSICIWFPVLISFVTLWSFPTITVIYNLCISLYLFLAFLIVHGASIAHGLLSGASEPVLSSGDDHIVWLWFDQIVYAPNITNLKHFQSSHFVTNWMSIARTAGIHGYFRRFGFLRCSTSGYHIHWN